MVAPRVPLEIDLGDVKLRRFAMADAPAFAVVRGHPAVSPWLPRVVPGSETWQAVAADAIRRGLENWAKDGFGPYAVIETGSGRLLGQHGLRYLPEFGAVEILYALHPDVQGRGLATRIARHCARLAFEDLDRDHVIAITMPENTASRRVMEKTGLTYRKMARFRDIDVVYYQLDRAPKKGRQPPG